jgi:protein required for attachment to host cells
MNNGTTWYVVADGGKARFLTLEGSEMRTLQSFDSGDHSGAEDDLSSTSQLKAPKSDPRELAKAHFAVVIADHLNEAVRTGQVDEIVLAASPHVLHDIREKLDKAASGKLARSLSKDLTNTPNHELAAHFG